MLKKTLLGIATATVVTTAALTGATTSASAGSFNLFVGTPGYVAPYHGYHGGYGWQPYAPAYYKRCKRVKVRYWNGHRYRWRKVRKCRRIYY